MSGSISYFLMFLGVGFLHGNVSSFGIRFFVSCCDAKFPRFDSLFRTSILFYRFKEFPNLFNDLRQHFFVFLIFVNDSGSYFLVLLKISVGFNGF